MRCRALLILLVLVVAVACSPDDGEGTAEEGAAAVAEGTEEPLETIPFPGATPGEAPATAEATDPPPDRSVTITSPADGDTVSSPVVLEVEVDGFTLAPVDGSFEDDRGHLYAYVDIPPPTEQDLVPEQDDIVRFAEPSVELPLEAGEHTISVIAAHGYPVPMMPIVFDEVTVTVQ